MYAQGSAIGDQLKHLAERRTDIFGSGAEETQIGKKVYTHFYVQISIIVDSFY